MESLFRERIHLSIDGYASKVVICDTNTEKHCLPVLVQSADIGDFMLITIPSGESSKTLTQCSDIIGRLIDNNIGTDSLIINLGGGVVSDIGGFVASIYKRGLSYINIPTSLLAMVDAAIGGKTGVDFDGVKNIIGTFNPPSHVITNHHFLKTLPHSELLSGFAEMLKYGIIADHDLLTRLITNSPANITLNDITTCQRIKENIVSRDPFDKGERKKLNFGHTFGHAFESLSLLSHSPISHGYAVAMGMVCELYLSSLLTNYPANEYNKISTYVQQTYPKFVIEKKDFDTAIGFMLNDKKNRNNTICPVLLDNEGNCVLNHNIDRQTIIKALSTFCQ